MKQPSIHYPHYYFLATDAWLDKEYSFLPFFFNVDAFFNQSKGSKYSFFIINSKKDGVVGRLNIAVTDASGFSPERAPFGSLEFDTDLAPGLILEFLQYLGNWLKDKKIKSIYIKSYPAIYNLENTAVFTNSLLQSGFTIQKAELNQHIAISKKTFIDRVSYSERKRINKCSKSNFRFGKSNIEHLPYAYKLIKQSRDRKNYPTSMTYKELENAFSTFSDNYILFTVSDNNQIVALSVSILINKKILYNFYHAHDEAYNHFSPITFLVQGVYEYCQQQKIEILDLGISTAEGTLNEGLYGFKKNLGACVSLKPSFYKKLIG